MMARLLPSPTTARAAAILREIFGRIHAPVAFRLWDGSEVRLSGDKALSTVVIKSPETFLGLIQDPTPYSFAEAYVSGAVDFEGDIFAVMPVANEIGELRVPVHQKLRLLLSFWKG
jgi:cyclopropane-fatty-acyl-phospholipid synthase